MDSKAIQEKIDALKAQLAELEQTVSGGEGAPEMEEPPKGEAPETEEPGANGEPEPEALGANAKPVGLSNYFKLRK